jgi:hypothetical protein
VKYFNKSQREQLKKNSKKRLKKVLQNKMKSLLLHPLNEAVQLAKIVG